MVAHQWLPGPGGGSGCCLPCWPLHALLVASVAPSEQEIALRRRYNGKSPLQLTGAAVGLGVVPAGDAVIRPHNESDVAVQIIFSYKTCRPSSVVVGSNGGF